MQKACTRVYAFPAAAAATFASSAAATAGLTFLPSFHRTRGGGARLRRPSRERTRTTNRRNRLIKRRVFEVKEETHHVSGSRKRHSMRF
jgi:hypothetical protein